MYNMYVIILEIRLEILLFFLEKLESLKKSFDSKQFDQFHHLLIQEKVQIENKLVK